MIRQCVPGSKALRMLMQSAYILTADSHRAQRNDEVATGILDIY